VETKISEGKQGRYFHPYFPITISNKRTTDEKAIIHGFNQRIIHFNLPTPYWTLTYLKNLNLFPIFWQPRSKLKVTAQSSGLLYIGGVKRYMHFHNITQRSKCLWYRGASVYRSTTNISDTSNMVHKFPQSVKLSDCIGACILTVFTMLHRCCSAGTFTTISHHHQIDSPDSTPSLSHTHYSSYDHCSACISPL